MSETTTGIDIDKRRGVSLWAVLRQAPDALKRAFGERGEGTEESRRDVLDETGLLIADVVKRLRKSRPVWRGGWEFADNQSDDPNEDRAEGRFSVRTERKGTQVVLTCLWKDNGYDELTIEEHLPASPGKPEESRLVRITTLTPEGIVCSWGKTEKSTFPARRSSLRTIARKVEAVLEPIRSDPPRSTEMITQEFPRPREY